MNNERLAKVEEDAAICIAELVTARRITLPKCESTDYRRSLLRTLFDSQAKMIDSRRTLEAKLAEAVTTEDVAVFKKSLEVCAAILLEICETVCIIRSNFPNTPKV